MTKKRKRFKDRRSVGASVIAPYKACETHRQRHARRLATGVEHREDVEAWCEERGVSFTVTNGEQHWKFTRGKNNRIVEWWPSTAKLVVAEKYRNGIHVHDYQQAIEILAKTFPVIERSPEESPERMGKYKTVKSIGMDLPIIAELGCGWYLAAHPNGACIANETCISVLWEATNANDDGSDVPQDIRDQAIEAFERFAWPRLKAEFYPEESQ